MKQFLNTIAVLTLFLSFAGKIQGQTCFEKFFREGQKRYAAGQPDLAIDQFKAARECAAGAETDSAEAWIAKSNTAYIENLKKARDEAQTSARRAAATALAAKAWNVYRYDHTLAFRLAAAALQSDPSNEDIRQTLRSIVNTGASFYMSTLKEQEFAVYALVFSPDSKRVALGTWDGSLIMYDLQGKVLFQALSNSRYFVPNGHNGTIQSIVWSKDGTYLLTAGLDGVVKKWDAGTGAFLKNIARVRAEVNDIEVMPDGKQFLTASRDSTARIWSEDGKVVKTLRGHTSDVNSVTCSSDYKYLLTGSKDGTAILWDTAGNLIRTIDNHAVVNSVAFSPDNQTILTASADNSAKRWSLGGSLLATYGTHTGWVKSAAFSPDGQYVLTGSWDNTAKIWSVGGREITTLCGHWEKVEAIAFSPDGQYVATGGYDFTAKIWDVSFNLKQMQSRHSSSVNTVTISPDGQHLLTGSQDLTAKIWDLKGNLLHDFTGHTDELHTVAYLPDGKRILTAGKDRTVRLWDVESGRLIKILPGHTQAIGDLTCSPDGKWIVTAEHNGVIHLWDGNGNPVKTWTAHNKKRITSVQFSPDSRKFVTGSRDSTAVIWDLEGRPLQKIKNDAWINCIAFSPDGHYLYTGGREYKVKRWNLDGALDKVYYGHTEEVYALSFGPAGDRFATGSWDNSAKIWDTSGVVLCNIPQQDAIFDVAISPKGDYLVTASRDNITRAYDLKGSLLVSIGTYEERQSEQFLNSNRIARLERIPFSFLRYGIPLEYTEMVFTGSPEGLVLQGNEFLKIARSQIADFQTANQNFDRAFQSYRKARGEISAGRTAMVDSCLAESYRWYVNHLIANRKFAEAHLAAREGLQHRSLDYLHIFSVVTALYAGQFDEAVAEATPLQKQAIHEISYYADYGEAFLGELDYFKQFGIYCPDEERFIKALGL